MYPTCFVSKALWLLSQSAPKHTEGFLFFKLGYGDLNKCEVQSLSTQPGMCPRWGPSGWRGSPQVEGTCFPRALGSGPSTGVKVGEEPGIFIHRVCCPSSPLPYSSFQRPRTWCPAKLTEGLPEKYHLRNLLGHVLSTKKIYLTQRDREQGKETETEDRERGRTGREEGRRKGTKDCLWMESTQTWHIAVYKGRGGNPIVG